MDERTTIPERESLIPLHGGYRKLKSFQVAQLVYDMTVRFCERYIDPPSPRGYGAARRPSRMADQMVQAARSGVQNIAEGSQASGTSKKTELKLTNVARASLEELRLDYEDLLRRSRGLGFLRQRGLALWERQDARRAELIARRCATADAVAEWVREVHERERSGEVGSGQDGQHGQSGPADGRGKGGGKQKSKESMKSTVSTYPEIAANAALVLIVVAISLLDRQLAAQAAAFEKEGGFTERLYRVRSQRRTESLR